MGFLNIFSSLFSDSKNTLITLIVIALLAFSAFVGIKYYSSINSYNKIEKEYNELKERHEKLVADYKLSEESNKKLKEINEENIQKATVAMESLIDQVNAERKLQNETIQKYREKIAILQKAKNVDPKETTGVADQDTSKAIIDRINSIIKEYNKNAK